jgi:hypothetical protein
VRDITDIGGGLLIAQVRDADGNVVGLRGSWISWQLTGDLVRGKIVGSDNIQGCMIITPNPQPVIAVRRIKSLQIKRLGTG